jgi:hypothetical protein
MVLVDGRGLPLGAEIASASPHEITLIEPLLDQRILPTKPHRLIYDAAANCNPLRTPLTNAASNWSPLIGRTAKSRLRKTAENSAATDAAGGSNSPSAGCRTFAGSSRVTKYYAHLFHEFVQIACLIVVMRTSEMASSFLTSISLPAVAYEEGSPAGCKSTQSLPHLTARYVDCALLEKVPQ